MINLINIPEVSKLSGCLTNRNFKLGFFCILGFFFWFSNSVEAQNTDLIEQSAIKLEADAERIKGEWSGQASLSYINLNSQAADLWEEIDNKPKQAECYRRIAKFESLLGNNETSLNILKNALKIEDSPKYLEGKIKTLSLLTNISLKLGQKKESEKFLQEALRLSDLTKNPVSKAMSAHSAAEFYYFQRDFTASAKFYNQAINHWQKTDDLIDYAQTLIDYGYFFMTISEPTKGLEILNQAEEKFQQIDNQRGLALTRIAIGHLYVSIDRNQSALKFYQLADKNFPEDTDFIERARLYNGIGLIYEDFGEWNLSLNYRQKALGLFQKDNYLQGQLTTLPSLVKLSYQIGDESSAAEYFSEIKELSARLNETFYLAITQKQIGDFYFDKHSDEIAADYYKKSLNVLQNFNSKSDFALIQNNFGVIYKRQENYALARRYYEIALKINQEIQDRFAEAETLYNLAELDHLEDNDEKALESIRHSIQLTEEITSDVFNTKLTRTYFSNVYDRYDLYIKLLMKMHRRFPDKNYALQALQASEKSRSRSLLENLRLTEVDFMQDADPEIVRREIEIRNLLNLKSNKLTDFLSNNIPKQEINKLVLEIENLANELENIKSVLMQKSPIYSAVKNPPDFDIKDFQNNLLDDNTLLLNFFFGKDESYLWLISKEDFQVVTLPNSEILDSRIEKIRQLLTSRGKMPEEEIDKYQTRIAVSEKEYEEEAQILSNHLFGQISDKLFEKRLILVPDGKLQYFPVSALPFPNKNGDSSINEPFLIKNEIIYQPSALTLSLLRKKKNGSGLPHKDIVVFADPIFSPEDERLSSADKIESSIGDDYQTSPIETYFRSSNPLKNLRRLESSKKESESIVQTIGDKNSILFSGFSANREHFLSFSLSDYKIIHFATHGILNEERPYLSGIVLSQFNKEGNKIDGFIRLQDIYGLNLSADLVVLSACDTGIGKDIKGEGLMSLTNGFLQVGAKSVVSSRWKVDDQATFVLMKDFYEELTKAELNVSGSLRQAQIRMRENPQYKSPFYWAAFTLHGDFHNKPNLTKSSDYSTYLVLLFSFLILFGIYFITKFFKKT